jgi:1-acyl-sn-glycerol-3-phosphate acyltransferase
MTVPVKMTASYATGWHIFRCYFSLYHRFRAFNVERVPLRGPVILACNHASYIDPPLVGSAVRRQINYLARDTIFKVPLVGSVLRSWEVVPVDRDGGTGRGLKAILDRLARGGAIILFPEGTRSRHGNLNPARAGIGLVVTKSSAPVVPARVFGTFQAYSARMFLPRPRSLVVKFGCPLLFESLRAEAQSCPRPRLREIYQQIADEIMAAIAALQPKEDA